jgi:hypothetical protein
MFKLEIEDLWEETKAVLTIGEFYGKCGGDNTQIIFT